MSLTPPGPPLPPHADESGDPGLPQDGAGHKSTLRALVVVALVLAVVAVGGIVWAASSRDDDSTSSSSPGSTSAPSPTAPLPTTAPSLEKYYGQKLKWHDCGDDKCATMQVPMDYAKPDGEEIGIAVLKVPAHGDRIGSLVVNPGGPGGSGTQFAAAGSDQFGTELTDHFDIVGFDPRGVGHSDTLKCLSTSGIDKLLAFDPDPDTQAERTEMDSLIAAFGQGCLDKSGDLARHMSTKEAAKDMDILRAALGEPKLDYLGSSYGTFLGATYADLFPTHVGRFVLDGAIDPALSNEQLSLQQGKGFETALRSYVKNCIDNGDCFLGSTVDAGTEKIREFLGQLDSKPLPTGSSRELTEGLGTLGVWMPLYVKDYWSLLTQALKSAIQEGDGSGLLQLADYYTSRGAKSYDDNSMESLYAVNCLDHDDYIPTSQVPSYFAEFEKASPTFGKVFAYSLSTCSTWPVRSGEHTVALHAKGAPPIVVIGTTRDPATPLAWAQSLAKELDSGRLITRDGDGHTGFQRGSSCVDDAVEKWLIQGKAPKPDLMCS
jgi:pimeloyl-ACP methyl ester carboxylesterase